MARSNQSPVNRVSAEEAHALARAVARLNRRLRQERRSELTPTQLAVLGTISLLAPATPGAVAAREGVQPPSLTRTLGSLVEAGLVVRRPHPDDGRQVLVSVSARGEDVLAAERERRDVWLAEQLEALPASERESLRRAAEVFEQIADA
jgi:DNA-binding MarR family transcriptional regulator